MPEAAIALRRAETARDCGLTSPSRAGAALVNHEWDRSRQRDAGRERQGNGRGMMVTTTAKASASAEHPPMFRHRADS